MAKTKKAKASLTKGASSLAKQKKKKATAWHKKKGLTKLKDLSYKDSKGAYQGQKDREPNQ